jgi:hypothetical protein
MSHRDGRAESQAERPADREAADAVVAHHAQLARALSTHTARVVRAAERSDVRDLWRGRAALLDWVHGELLPHATAEEAALYPAAAARPEGAALIEGMLAEHKTIMTLVDELEGATGPVRVAAAARALAAVFDLHLAKENELVVPLLVAADDVALADLLAGMHDLLGGHRHAAPASAPPGAAAPASAQPA